MEKISWLDKVTNEEVFRRANEDRQILNSVWQRKHRWICYVSRHDRLLHEITEGKMKGKPTRGRRRIQMLHDLAIDGGFVALKWAAEDREGWRHRERMSKNAIQQKTTDDDDSQTVLNDHRKLLIICIIIIIIIIFFNNKLTSATSTQYRQ